MNIVEINYADLVGHAFNGFDLHRELIKRGIHASQIVLDKRSDCDSVKKLAQDQILHHQIRQLEREYSISNLLYPYGEEIIKTAEFKTADLVHYHILHNGMVSLLDYPRLMNAKKSVWTVHDPWIVTGNCVHPLDCDKWKSGCGECRRTNEKYFEMNCDNTDFMWKQKKQIFSQINPNIIVSCDFMEKYLQNSPITQHFTNIYVIPFGVDADKYVLKNKREARSLFGVGNNKVVIGFRADSAAVKGCKYMYEALRKITQHKNIQLLSVGSGAIPEDIKEKYNIKELGWVDGEEQMIQFYQLCDLFLMPSLAETFGLMAIEAMAAECAVICFQDTVLEEITSAPDIGIAVPYLSADRLASEISCLVNHPEELKRRGKRGNNLVRDKYSFEQYVKKHIELYCNVQSAGGDVRCSH